MIARPLKAILGRGLGLSALMLGAFLILLSRLPIITGPFFIAPEIPLIFTVYWAMKREEPIPALGIFLLGLFDDLLSGGMPFANAILLTGIQRLVIDQKKAYLVRTPKIALAAFSAIVLGWGFLYWLMNCVYARGWLPADMLLKRMAVTILVLPVFVWFLGGFHRVLSEPPSR